MFRLSERDAGTQRKNARGPRRALMMKVILAACVGLAASLPQHPQSVLQHETESAIDAAAGNVEKKGARCEGWCAGHTQPWATKCSWDTLACAGCEQCDSPVSAPISEIWAVDTDCKKCGLRWVKSTGGGYRSSERNAYWDCTEEAAWTPR